MCFAALTGCASTKLRDTWVDGGYEDGPLQSVMVVGLGKDVRSRGLFEQELVSRLNGRGVAAVAGSGVAPAGGDFDVESIRRKARALRIQSVLVTTLISVDRERSYVSGQPMRYYGYFDPATGREYSPGTYDEVEVVRLQTRLYIVATGMLIWSAASETVDPLSDERLVKSLGEEIIDDLTKRGLLKG